MQRSSNTNKDNEKKQMQRSSNTNKDNKKKQMQRSSNTNNEQEESIQNHFTDTSNSILKYALTLLTQSPDNVTPEFDTITLKLFLPLSKIFRHNIKFDGEHYYDNLISEFDPQIFILLKRIYDDAEFRKRKPHLWRRPRTIEKIYDEIKYQVRKQYSFDEKKAYTIHHTTQIIGKAIYLDFCVTFQPQKTGAFIVQIYFLRYHIPKNNNQNIIRKGWNFAFVFVENIFDDNPFRPPLSSNFDVSPFLDSYSLKIGDFLENLYEGYGIQSDMKLQEIIYQMEKEHPYNIEVPDHKKKHEFPDGNYDKNRLTKAIFKTPQQQNFFYVGKLFINHDTIYSARADGGNGFLGWFLNDLFGTITWSTRETCKIFNGNFIGTFYIIDGKLVGEYIDESFNGFYRDNFLEYPMENVKLEYLLFRLRLFPVREFQLILSVEQQGQTTKQKPSQRQQEPTTKQKTILSKQGQTTKRKPSQRQQEPTTKQKTILSQQGQKPSQRQQGISTKQKTILSKQGQKPSQQGISTKTTIEKKKKGAFNEKQNKNTMFGESSSSKNFAGSTQKEISNVKNFLTEYLDQNILNNSEEFKENLHEFIANCSKLDPNKTKLNNRRKLIFRILKIMDNEKIINIILKNLAGKQIISIVDLVNYAFAKNIQNSSNIIEHFRTNEIYDPNTFFIFVRQTNYFPNKKLIELTYDENLDIIIIDVACTTIFDNTMQTENNPKQKIDNSTSTNNKKIVQTQCFLDKTFPKNPLDDFVILVIAQCIYEFCTLRGVSPEFIKIYPFTINDLNIVSNDEFKDWNIEKKIDGYKTNGYRSPIFNFDFLDYGKKRDFIQKINPYAILW